MKGAKEQNKVNEQRMPRMPKCRPASRRPKAGKGGWMAERKARRGEAEERPQREKERGGTARPRVITGVIRCRRLDLGAQKPAEGVRGQEGVVVKCEGRLEELPRTARLYVMETLKPSL